MIRFSAVLVVVAMGMLAGGVATSRLSWVYIAIAVSAGALLTLAIGIALKRKELFGEKPALAPAGAGGGPDLPFAAGDGSPQPNGSAASQTVAFSAPSDHDRPSFGPGTFGRPGESAAPWQTPPARDPWSAPDTIRGGLQPGGVAERAVGGWSGPPRGGGLGSWGGQDAPDTEPGRSPLPGWQGRKPGAEQAPPYPQPAAERTAPAAGFTPPKPPPSPAQSWRDRREPSSGSAGPSGGSEPSSWLSPSFPLSPPGSPGAPGPAVPWGERPVPSFHPTPSAPGTVTPTGDTARPPGAPRADADAKTPAWFGRPAAAKPPAGAKPASAATDDEPADGDVVDGDVADGDAADDPTLDAGDRRPAATDDAADTADTADTEDTADAVPAPAAEDAGAEGDDGAAGADAENAGNTAKSTGESGVNLVTVVPGVPRYHDSNCILIRFMDEDDVQKLTVSAAREAGCTPCAACQPES